MIKTILKYSCLAGAASLMASPAFAQEAPAHSVFILNSLLFLMSGFLVMFMACGFCMLEAGLVRAKNTTMQLTKNVALFSLAAIGYYLIGYNLMYPLGTWSVEGVLSGLLPVAAVLEAVGVAPDKVDDISYASTGSDFFFQLMFCAATASIVSGVLAERIKLWPFLLFTFVLTAVIYPLQASWKWGGGFLDSMGFLDFAGSTVVHSVGGWAALAGVLILGPRIGKYKDGRVVPMPGANLPLATLGTFILWMGWFGFNEYQCRCGWWCACRAGTDPDFLRQGRFDNGVKRCACRSCVDYCRTADPDFGRSDINWWRWRRDCGLCGAVPRQNQN